MIDAALLPALLSLLAVARSGSVGAAARLQHRTSSAISQQIRKLERHLDVKLLERAGRGVRLTAAGEAALPGILQLGTETEALFAQLAELSGRPPAILRVAVSDYLGRDLLVPVLHELLEEQPRLRFEIATTHSRESVRLVGLGEVDCAVVTGQDSGSRQRSLGHLDPKSHRGEQIHASLEMLAFDSCRRRNYCDCIARLERGRFDYLSLHAVLRAILPEGGR